MNNEELNKKIEFIIEHQAQFAADIQVMREVHAADTKLLKEETNLLKEETKLLKEETKLLKEQFSKLSDAVMTVVGLIGGLAQAQAATSATVAELAERLNIFIGVVERYMSGNGGSGPRRQTT